MDAIETQIRELYSKADERTRLQLHVRLRDLQSSLIDDDWNLVARLGTGVSLPMDNVVEGSALPLLKPLQMALVKVGTDLHIFEKLAASNEPLTLSNLAAETGAAPDLLGRILRAIAAFGLVSETGKDEFSPNRTTRALAEVNASGAIYHVFEIHGLSMHALPDFLAEKKYQTITSNKDLPFQKAFNTELTTLDWLKTRPEHMKSLGHAMAIQRQSNWTDHYPVEEEVGSFEPASDSALLVDVGGGFGQQAIAFRNKYTGLPGRIIVQDMPETLDRAAPASGIQFMVQDFSQPQVVKNAKFYYLRHILHDWTDEDCVKILTALIPAMGPESRIVIDEVVLPDQNVPWVAAYMDMVMMTALGGIERTKAQWEGLLDLAGLRIVNIRTYDSKMQSVILAIPK